jgi:hypothetical protein
MGGEKQLIMEPLKNMLNTVAIYLPFLFGALLILFIGWVVAKLLSSLVEKGLDKVKFNEFSAKLGLSELLTKGGLYVSPTSLVSAFVYWVLMIVVLATTLQAIGLEVAAKLLERVTGYVPSVIAAVFVLIVGMFLANFVSGAVRAAAKNMNLNRAELLAGITKTAILVFTWVSALEQLSIATFFVTTTFQIFFAAVCLALALSFGLGGKDLAARILWDFYNQQNEKK